MRVIFFLFFSYCITGCNNPTQQGAVDKKSDSLDQYHNVYKPGFGEFMSSIQMHHAKLWFAGINENWQLADFEIHEMQEAADGIQKFCPDRPETKMIELFLTPALNSMNDAIAQKKIALFKDRFVFLTNSCNNCHKENSFGFNMVTIPTTPPFSNQDFKINH